MDRITKSDLENLRRQIVSDISHLLNKKLENSNEHKEFEWLRSKAMREYLNISAATLQNLRVSGKIRSRKIMGSYYYNKADLENLFKHEK
ncbi:helix-turn-helix domain-containing protein [Chishuiella sp.]|uniref:helix-turn-helix domain-containing protein n=1 Tax=Chishuiella sp. TaxID=1969467 RepID=UPI0028AF5A4E|nr:helix-turn-helix domain-containing protein [Chishuiella sp.]